MIKTYQAIEHFGGLQSLIFGHYGLGLDQGNVAKNGPKAEKSLQIHFEGRCFNFLAFSLSLITRV